MAYADLTLLGGRHRWRHITSAGLPELHPIADRLVCATIYDGADRWLAVNRECPCGNQLCVSTAVLELVEARKYIAICLGCHLSDRSPLELPAAAMPTLHLAGCSADAWRTVAHLNGLEFERARSTLSAVQVRRSDDAHRHTGDHSSALKRAGA